jgi:hypothetical protein
MINGSRYHFFFLSILCFIFLIPHVTHSKRSLTLPPLSIRSLAAGGAASGDGDDKLGYNHSHSDNSTLILILTLIPTLASTLTITLRST